MKKILIALACLALTSCGEEAARDDRFDGMMLVKICIDGTYIYWFPKIGEYRTGGLANALVKDPETVCARQP